MGQRWVGGGFAITQHNTLSFKSKHIGLSKWTFWPTQCIHICMRVLLSHVRLFATPYTVVHQANLSMKFSRQDYWKGLTFPTPGDLSDPEIKHASLTSSTFAGRFFNHWTIWEAHIYICICIYAYIHIFIIIFILSFSIYLSNIYLTRDVGNWKNMILVKKKKNWLKNFFLSQMFTNVIPLGIWSWDFLFQSCVFCLLIQFSRQVIGKWMRWSRAWISPIPGV